MSYLDSEAKIIAECERRGTRYEDPHFTLSVASNISGATWLRPQQAFGVATPRLFAPEGRGTAAFVLGTSRLATSWLLDVLAALVPYSAQIERLFPPRLRPEIDVQWPNLRPPPFWSPPEAPPGLQCWRVYRISMRLFIVADLKKENR